MGLRKSEKRTLLEGRVLEVPGLGVPVSQSWHKLASMQKVKALIAKHPSRTRSASTSGTARSTPRAYAEHFELAMSWHPASPER